MASAYSRSNDSGSSGWFTLPHHTWSAAEGSRTTNLSPGLRPVWGLVTAQNGPDSASTPSPRRTACSYSAAGPRFQYTARSGAKPSSVAPERRAPLPAGDGAIVCMRSPLVLLVRGPRVAAMFQGVQSGEHRQIDDIAHLRTSLQDVYRLGHTDQHRADGLGAAQPGEQLVGDVRGVEVGEYQHVRGGAQPGEGVGLGEDTLHHRRIGLHLPIHLELGLALVQQLDRAPDLFHGGVLHRPEIGAREQPHARLDAEAPDEPRRR